ncbi:hypothetical protein HK101_006389 [Irineochytrium annulatum]|nr:hypothetical protein HK101_006389 [Irineochytrium annulatum]
MHFTAVIAFVLSAASLASARVNSVHWKQDPVNVKSTAERAENLERRVSANLEYYGGPVISNVVVNPIWYGATADKARISSFYKGVTDSPYFDMLSEYGTATQSIGRGKLGTPYTETKPSSRSSLTDATLETYLMNLVKTGKINPTDNSYYPIHFGPKYSITNPSGKHSCVNGGFCAYHGTIDISSISDTQYLYYGVIPDQYSTGCSSGCGTSPTPFNNLCSVASHELAEAVTDAAVGVAPDVGAPLGWYDSNNGEIGDICNAMEGSVVGGDGITYTVQRLWSNTQGRCIV